MFELHWVSIKFVTKEFTPVKITHLIVKPVILVHAFKRYDMYTTIDEVKLSKLPALQAM